MIYSRRIDEKRGSNRRGPNGNKWLYPDVVGMENLSADWHREVKSCVAQYSDKQTKLWSFEVKLLRITSYNVCYTKLLRREHSQSQPARSSRKAWRCASSSGVSSL